MATKIEAYLAEQGLSTEEIAALVGNPKAAAAMSAALAKYDEGTAAAAQATTDLEAAKTAKEEAETFWEEKVTPALAGVDRKVATATSEAARYKAYLQSLKDQGYDVPADLLTAPTTTTPATTTPTGLTREDMNKEFRSVAPTMVSLVALSNEYADLFGAPYVAADQDWEEAQRLKKPFREHVRAKYKFEDKRKEKAAASENTRIDALVAERVKTKEAELQAKYGSNPETRVPLASKMDKLQPVIEKEKDSWKSAAGRAAAKKDRLSRFEKVIQ